MQRFFIRFFTHLSLVCVSFITYEHDKIKFPDQVSLALFFTSFILLGAYVLLSLIIASILDKFTENAVNEGLLSTANIFVTVRRKLLLDTFSTKLKMKLDSFKVKKPTRGARKKK